MYNNNNIVQPSLEFITGSSLLSEAYQTMSDTTSWYPIGKTENKSSTGVRECKDDCEIQSQEKNEIMDEVTAMKTLFRKYAINRQKIDLLKKQINQLESQMKTVIDSSAQILLANENIKAFFETNNVTDKSEMTELREAERVVKSKFDIVFGNLFRKWSEEMKSYKKEFSKLSNEQGTISQLISEGMKINKESRSGDSGDSEDSENNNSEFSEAKCSICCDKTVNRVLVPCGHTFCHECVQIKHYSASLLLTQNNTCSICRGSFDKIIPLFIS